MPRRLQRQIDRLQAQMLELARDVEESLRSAIQSVEIMDIDLARQTIARDETIDMAEVDLEEECLKLLALYQPVAVDLRYIVTILKVNNDLERIGDLAVNIAERTELFADSELMPIAMDFGPMAELATGMLRNALRAMVEGDVKMAYQVCEDDERVDEMHRGFYSMVEAYVSQHPEHAVTLVRHLSVSRFVERIADHATNIAEDVIYLLQGEIVRHRLHQFCAPENNA